MANKVITGILVFLVILGSSIGYYSYSLNLQIISLDEQLTTLQLDQAAQDRALGSELAALKEENLMRSAGLQNEIAATRNTMGNLENELLGEIDKAATSIDTIEDEIGETSTRIDTLEDSLSTVAAQFSQSAMNASEVYQMVNQATVRISDGERTIGSGFIFGDETHVMTAHHVVASLTNIYVILPDGRVSAATMTGSSVHSDIAVLTLRDKLDVEPLPMADSDKVRIGEPVAAIGSPFDLTDTLTTGIVSQTNRYTEINYDFQTRWVANLIQFDAAANPGNSGGPVFNSAGEVIGMVIARIDPGEGDGIYYAVSSNKLKRVADSLIAKGSYDYPRIGINVSDITPQLARDRGLASINGALVRAVPADGPARTAGIEADDIIVAIDGQTVNSTADLTSYLGEHKSPGDDATIELIRGNSRLEISLKIGKA